MASAMTTAAGKGTPGCASPVSDPLDFCMEWNAEGQLKRVALNGNEVARFAYDPTGRRVEKVAAGVITSYLYDGRDIVSEAGGTVVLRYVHGPETDEPLAREWDSGPLTYYHADGLGSVVKRTNQAGVAVHNYEYDAWGSLEAGAGERGFAFTGREWDPEIGLYYYRARYYDPRIGRFISEDPSGGEDRAQLYAYAADNPSNGTDPSGLYTVKTNDKGFNQKIEDAMTKLSDELLNSPQGCHCLFWFTSRDGDLLAMASPGGPPSVTYNKKWPSSIRGEAHPSTQSIELNYEAVMLNESCLIAGYIVHELAHLVGYPADHPDWGLQKDCTFGCVSTPRGGGH